MDRDKNLLFGVLAVQLRKVTPGQIADIAAAWAADPVRDLPNRLVEAKLLSPADQAPEMTAPPKVASTKAFTSGCA